MESPTYELDRQLKLYKEAIKQTSEQLHLDNESRIAAACATLNAALADYLEMDKPYQSREVRERIGEQRARIEGMLSLAAACHLLPFKSIKDFKDRVGIESVEVPLRIRL